MIGWNGVVVKPTTIAVTLFYFSILCFQTWLGLGSVLILASKVYVNREVEKPTNEKAMARSNIPLVIW